MNLIDLQKPAAQVNSTDLGFHHNNTSIHDRNLGVDMGIDMDTRMEDNAFFQPFHKVMYYCMLLFTTVQSRMIASKFKQNKTENKKRVIQTTCLLFGI